jgi:cephalosporin hydroxylase
MSGIEFERQENIAATANNRRLQKLSQEFLKESARAKYSYNFNNLGRPIIQYPEDIVTMQELIWATRPDLIIETGIAHGGSLVMSSSMLAILDVCDAVEKGEKIDPSRSSRLVIGIDIDIRDHNRKAIENLPKSSRIKMLSGSSIEPKIIEKVRDLAKIYRRILACLDSNHTHEHVLAELEAYAPLTTVGSYCVVFDTIIKDLPNDMFPERSWGKGNNTKSAVWEYLKNNDMFEIDNHIQSKLLLSTAPDGFLKRVQ